MTITFGKYIADIRKTRGWTQKELAAKIKREDDGESISPQYLNDIERDRRQPSSDHMVAQFAKVLDIQQDYLHYLIGTMPLDVRKKNLSEAQVAEVMRAFRKTGTK